MAAMAGILFPMGVVMAGGGPQNVLVVVNDNSLISLEIGKYYQEKRGIPEQNIFHVSTTTNYSMSTVDFTNQVRGPILNYITNSTLNQQIDYVVFTPGMPYRVYYGAYSDYRHSSISASMFYDFKSSPDAYVSGCNVASGSQSDYYESEHGFSRAAAPSSNRYFLSTVLPARDRDQCKRLIDRSVSADGTFPTGTVYFLHTFDARNVQWPQFENEDFLARFLTISQSRSILHTNTVVTPVNGIGYMVGKAFVSPGLNTFQPGGIGDHLTSYGGVLYSEIEFQQPNREQDRILKWIDAGCAASYGTVVEPCAETNKFAQARLHYWYARGFNMAESYSMAVRNPYQGVVIGDPLCAPYSIMPSVSISGITNGQILSGINGLTVAGMAASSVRPVDQLSLYLDGAFLATLTNVTPRQGNVITVTLNATNQRSYTVPANADLYSVATGLAARVHAPPTLGITNKAWGDRLDIRQIALGVPGTSLTCMATSSNGTAGELTVSAWSPFTNFLETTYQAKKQLILEGTPATGDVLRLIITRLDGVVVTNSVTATISENTPAKLLTRLMDIVNTNGALTSTSGCVLQWLIDWGPSADLWVVSRTNTYAGYNLFIDYQIVTNTGSGLSTNDIFSSICNGNKDVMAARASVFLAEGLTNLAVGYSLNTTNLSDGPHELMAVAYEGTALKTQGRSRVPFIVDNNVISCTITQPIAQANFSQGSMVTVMVDATVSPGSITQVTLYVEGKAFAQATAPPWQFTWSTTNYGAGQVSLQALAHDQAGESAFSPLRPVTLFTDTDGDGLSDQWEYARLGSATNYNGTADPDVDQFNNLGEYIADTLPLDSNSLFRVQSVQGQTTNLIGLTFIPATTRVYRVYFNDSSLINPDAWQAGSNEFWGSNGQTTWWDDGTDFSMTTNDYRYYRIKVRRP